MEVCEKAIIIQESMRRIILHVCRKVNDRVKTAVTARMTRYSKKNLHVDSKLCCHTTRVWLWNVSG